MRENIVLFCAREFNGEVVIIRNGGGGYVDYSGFMLSVCTFF